MPIYLLIPLATVLLIIIITLAVYLITFYAPSKSKNKPLPLPKTEQGASATKIINDLMQRLSALPFEEVWITAHDGIRLFGRYYHLRDGAPLQIQFHGYRGTALRDFCGGHALARELGHNVLMVDQRAHGQSQGHTISFGVRERQDCKAWVEYAVDRFGNDTEIILSGVSMGAATVIMASDLDLPNSVKGIIADCPYTSPISIIRKVCRKDLHLPAFLSVFALMGGFAFGGGLNILKSDSLSSIAATTLPVLLLHGESDGFVPCDMSRRIKAAGGEDVTLETFKGADHGMSSIVDPPRYKAAVVKFLNQCLNQKLTVEK